MKTKGRFRFEIGWIQGAIAFAIAIIGAYRENLSAVLFAIFIVVAARHEGTFESEDA